MVIALNKPYGVLSQFNQNPDYPDQRTLVDFGLPPELHPVGRLDMDSEGLLLLTDDKQIESKLLDPEFGHKRRYLVQVDGKPDALELAQLRDGGLKIKNYYTKKCRVELLKNSPMLEERDPPVDDAAAKRSSWLRIELTEGKNRQVRRMTAKIGCPTLRLIRESIGKFMLSDMPLGEWRVLSDEEVELLWQR